MREHIKTHRTVLSICNEPEDVILNRLLDDFDRKDQKIANLETKLTESEKKVEELKGERLKFYTDDVRRTQVINGVHFDIEHLLVFSEYVEHENWVKANKDKEIDKLKQELNKKDEQLEIHNKAIKKLLKNCGNANCEIKISFAVEQLEKVKEELSKHYGEEVCGYVVDKIIDNQIKEIKGREVG